MRADEIMMPKAFRIWREAIEAGKPLTPEQARRRADKQRKANQKLADTQAKAAISVRAARDKILDL